MTARFPAHAALLATIMLLFGGPAVPQSTWRDDSPHTEGTVNANGITLHYLDWGGRPERGTILFLTGMGVTPHLFDGLAPQFTDHYHVLGVTRRGLGKSSRPHSGYDTATLTEDVRGFLDALKLDRVVLVGWSLGGTEMTRFATRYPARVDRLIYLEAAYDFAPYPAIWANDPVSNPPTAAEMASFEASKAWFIRTQGMWSDAVEADARAINLQPDGTMNPDATGPAISKQLMDGMVGARPDFVSIKAPVLAFYAVAPTHPFVLPDTPDSIRSKGEKYWQQQFLPLERKQIAAFKKTLPTARVVELETNHLCFIRPEDERVVVREMRAFLK
jgi:pimeloyl-ACP methyl ester carboxylesterase